MATSDFPSQAQAWIHALTPGTDARTRLAQCLADGVDPWHRAAVVVRWNTLSLSLPEVVLMGKEALGMEEVRRRMALIGRYTSVASTPHQKQVALELVGAAMKAGVPLPDLTLWRKRAGKLTDKQTQDLAHLGLSIALDEGGERGGELLGWVHRRVLGWLQWPDPTVLAIESSEDPQVRDAYWALVRDPVVPARAGRMAGPG